MNSTQTKRDKSIVIKSEFHYGQTRQMVSIDERQYDTTKLTRTSQKRLLAVIESIPLNCHHTQFESDFSPVVFLHWKVSHGDAGMFPAAYPRPVAEPECAKCGRLLDGDSRCWHCDYSDAEVEALIADEDTPRFGAGGGNPVADLDAVEVLGAEYNAYRSACDMAERIAPQAHISEPAALALAQRIVEAGTTASSVVIGTAIYGFDTVLYGVIYEAADGNWHMLSGWMQNGRLYTLHTGYSHSQQTMRWNFRQYQEAVMFEVAI